MMMWVSRIVIFTPHHGRIGTIESKKAPAPVTDMPKELTRLVCLADGGGSAAVISCPPRHLLLHGLVFVSRLQAPIVFSRTHLPWCQIRVFKKNSSGDVWLNLGFFYH